MSRWIMRSWKLPYFWPFEIPGNWQLTCIDIKCLFQFSRSIIFLYTYSCRHHSPLVCFILKETCEAIWTALQKQYICLSSVKRGGMAWYQQAVRTHVELSQLHSYDHQITAVVMVCDTDLNVISPWLLYRSSSWESYCYAGSYISTLGAPTRV